MTRKLSLIAIALIFGMSSLMAQSANRGCGTMDYLQQQLKNDPAMNLRMQQIEAQTAAYARLNAANKTTMVVTIPVVFHVLYSTNNATQNISDARINAQLDVLNKDFSRTNADAGNTPAVFQGVAANTGIQFCLAVRDPNGVTTTGIIRKQTAITSFVDDDVKFNATGGDDAWPTASYLNIWVCNLGGGLLGYAQFPGGPANTDGVVLLNGSVGGPAAPGTSTPYHLGRTATHEVGHWLNLRHIWGDANCGNDLVSDTPTQQTSNFGCPTFPHVTCSNGPNGDMFMNYMDYVDDNCMNMFTAGQSTRSNAVLAAGGARSTLASSQGCVPVGGGTCGPPASKSATGITQTSATISWAAVPNAVSYKVAYRVSGTTTWTTKSSTTTSKILTGLTAGTQYNYKVRAVCAANGPFTTVSNFTTLPAGGGCTGVDAYEPNETKATAVTIPMNTDVYPLISSATDNDYFKFLTTSTAPKIKIVVDGLVADYDVILYKASDGSQLAISQNAGTAAEQIIYNAGTTGVSYKVYVYGYNGAFNATSCYHIKIFTSATPFRQGGVLASDNDDLNTLFMYPNPAADQVSLSFMSNADMQSTISIVDMMGRTVLTSQEEILAGSNEIDLDLSSVQKGVYTILVEANGTILKQKLVVQK